MLAAVFALVNLASGRFVVEGESMRPNFITGEFLVVSRVHYLFGQPQRGDIVVFHSPDNNGEDYLKRVIGLPGETVEIRQQQVYINDLPLHETYILETCLPGDCFDQRWTLGATEYFVMGDNRNNSDDSRRLGPIDQHYLVGEALFRYWPPRVWGSVSQIGFPE